MGTKLYFHDDAPSAPATLPAAEKSGSSQFPGTVAYSLKEMTEAIGASRKIKSFSTQATAAQQRVNIQSWCSTPLLAGQTIGASPIEVSIVGSTVPGINFSINSFNIFVWRPSTNAKVGTIIDMVPTKSGASETDGNKYQVAESIITGTTPVAALAGDIVVCEAWCIYTQDSAVSRPVKVSYNGTVENTLNGASVGNFDSTVDHAGFCQFSETFSSITPEEGVGAADGAATVTGVGAATVARAGSAAGAATALGTPSTYHSGVGSSDGGGTVAAVGTGIVSGVANSDGTSVAIGVAQFSLTQFGVGNSDGAATVEGVGMQYFPHLFIQEATISETWTQETPL